MYFVIYNNNNSSNNNKHNFTFIGDEDCETRFLLPASSLSDVITTISTETKISG